MPIGSSRILASSEGRSQGDDVVMSRHEESRMREGGFGESGCCGGMDCASLTDVVYWLVVGSGLSGITVAVVLGAVAVLGDDMMGRRERGPDRGSPELFVFSLYLHICCVEKGSFVL
jgi:hypothetical protein